MFSGGEVQYHITYLQMGICARQFASALKQAGIEKGDKVLLLSENCPQWPAAYFGIALAGAVSVPLLTGFSHEQIQNIKAHCGARAICVSRNTDKKPAAASERRRYENSGNAYLPFCPEIPVIYIDSLKESGASNAEILISVNGVKKQLNLSAVECDDHYSQKSDDLASIIYTSGTQGNSKGVMLSSKNLLTSALTSLTFVKLYPNDRLLSVLPLAHCYECSLGLIAPIICGSSITYIDRPPSPSVLLPAFKHVKPTAIITVPLLIEKIYNNAIAPKLRKSKFYNFFLTRPLAAMLAGRKLICELGGKLRFLGIGGAPLSPSVEEFLFNARFPYAVGYGLTEAAPLVAGNSPLRFTLKSGIIIPKNIKMRIDQFVSNKTGEGEIQVQGSNIMAGYFNDEKRTRETITNDGWLKTGDLGRIDKKGRLHIIGRLKAIILGPSGENIYPEEIEGLLGSSGLIEESLVYSGKKGELVALVRLNEAAQLKQRAKNAAGAIENALEELRTWVNKKLAVFSRLNRIEIKYEPFEKTPTMKIKRYLYV